MSSEVFTEVCGQARRIFVRKVFSEILDPHQRTDALLAVCIEVLRGIEPEGGGLLRAIDAITSERTRRAAHDGA